MIKEQNKILAALEDCLKNGIQYEQKRRAEEAQRQLLSRLGMPAPTDISPALAAILENASDIGEKKKKSRKNEPSSNGINATKSEPDTQRETSGSRERLGKKRDRSREKKDKDKKEKRDRSRDKKERHEKRDKRDKSRERHRDRSRDRGKV